jgi:glycerol kinase
VASGFLGIDLGTTLCTAVLVDDTGVVVDGRSEAIATRHPGRGRVEQGPADLIQALTMAAEPLLAAHHVRAVGLANQGESFLLWDARTGAPLTPNIVWQDQRGDGVCRDLRDRVDPVWLAERTGLKLDSYFTAPKLSHVLATHPALRRAAQDGTLRMGTTDTWAVWCLTGGAVHVTDPSTASRTLLYNIVEGCWDDTLLALFGVPRVILPRVQTSVGALAELSFPGVPGRVPLWAMLCDQQAALLGQGCLSPGEAKCTLGTGAFLLGNLGSRPRLSRTGLLTTVAWQLADGAFTYALDGGVFCLGAAVQWLAESLRVIPSVAESADLARQATDDDVVVVPALSGLSAPRWWTEARGAALGLSLRTTGADLARATLDGLACQVADLVEAMGRDGCVLTLLKVDGGPTRNGYLTQRLADLCGIPVWVAANPEATAAGVAHLAAHGCAGVPLEDLARGWRCARVHDPAVTALERERLRERWRRAVDAVGVFHGRRRLEAP